MKEIKYFKDNHTDNHTVQFIYNTFNISDELAKNFGPIMTSGNFVYYHNVILERIFKLYLTT